MKKILYILFVLAYIVCAPIYINNIYYTNNDLKYPEFQSYAYLWITTKRDFNYFLLGGTYKTQLSDKSIFVFRTETKEYQSIQITDAEIVHPIKGMKIDEIIGKTYPLDKTLTNMYGGSGGTASVEFKLPISELRDIEININMILIDNKGFPHKIIFKRKLLYIEKSSYILMYQFIQSLLLI